MAVLLSLPVFFSAVNGEMGEIGLHVGLFP